jgi:hypothetical protein
VPACSRWWYWYFVPITGTIAIAAHMDPQSIGESLMGELRFLWKDDLSSSSGTGCPALYETEGGFVVQGLRLDDATRAKLRELADNEDAVFVPANVLDRLAGRG